MRISKLLGKTYRDSPSDAKLISHKLMLRAAMIQQSSSGVYSYLPMAWRSLRKIESIIREEMDAYGGQELRLPVIHPRELWDQSGRTETYGPDLFTLKDRRDRPLVMAPTHEEMLTSIAKASINSYRDLPVIAYQIQTKFRDELRPRGGLVRVREFDMKDAYSLDMNEEGLDISYNNMVNAYKKIYSRCSLPVVMIEADSGAIGGRESNEFVLITDSGEDTILQCTQCSYAANMEKAKLSKPQNAKEDLLTLKEVSTPEIKTINALAKFLNIPTSKTLKSMFYIVDGDVLCAAIRGDLEINEIKLRNYLKAKEVRTATLKELDSIGLTAGSASPVGVEGIRVIVDDSVEMGANFVAGANKHDYHLINTNYPRDFQAEATLDIAMATSGSKCPNCNALMKADRGIEVGHVFKLGTHYSEVLGAYYSDINGNQQPIVMGCYGIGVGRLLAAIIEQHHDDKGIIFPKSIAPYQVCITALNMQDSSVSNYANTLYENLQDNNIEVLFDDRLESPGAKLNDADIMGIPLRIVVSQRNIKQQLIEIKFRSEADASTIPIDQAIDQITNLISH